MKFYDELLGIYNEVYSRVYDKIVEKNKQIAEPNNKLVSPLFIYPSDEYNNADIKLMIFGQETNRWHTPEADESVEKIMETYNKFFWCVPPECYNKRKHGGPFWDTIKHLTDRLQNQNKDKKIGHIWNNLIKIGKHGNGFPWMYNCYSDIIKPYFNELIIKEIEILKPDFIVFFSGPNYDWILSDIFKNVNKKLIQEFRERQLCEIELLDFPNIKKSLRTYHPKFLFKSNRKRPKEDFIKKIIDEINKSFII